MPAATGEHQRAYRERRKLIGRRRYECRICKQPTSENPHWPCAPCKAKAKTWAAELRHMLTLDRRARVRAAYPDYPGCPWPTRNWS